MRCSRTFGDPCRWRVPSASLCRDWYKSPWLCTISHPETARALSRSCGAPPEMFRTPRKMRLACAWTCFAPHSQNGSPPWRTIRLQSRRKLNWWEEAISSQQSAISIQPLAVGTWPLATAETTKDTKLHEGTQITALRDISCPLWFLPVKPSDPATQTHMRKAEDGRRTTEDGERGAECQLLIANCQLLLNPPHDRRIQFVFAFDGCARFVFHTQNKYGQVAFFIERLVRERNW